MRARQSVIDRRIDLTIIELDRDTACVEDCHGRLSDDEKVRAARFVRERDRERWIVSRGELRRVLGDACGSDARSVSFVAGHNGKPMLGDQRGDSPLHFNLSHSGALAVVALTRVGPLGVDVEATRRIADRDAVVARFFSEAEQAAYRALPEEARGVAFYNGWTRKEAVIKATGEGLSADLGAFDVSLAPDEPPRTLAVGGSVAAARRWQLFSLRPCEGYTVAVAIQARAAVSLRVCTRSAFPSPEAMG